MLPEHIAAVVRLPLSFVDQIARSASHRYKVYSIPKKSGGTRAIFHPAKELKLVQRAMLSEVVVRWPVHDAAMAYRKGISIADNARVHRGAKYLLRMDFKQFFPSFTMSHLVQYANANAALFPDWTREDWTFFCNCVLRFGRLTIGAPTSPAITNALCFELDTSLEELAGSLGVRYTRYADDLFFSTRQRDVLATVEEGVRRTVASLKSPALPELNGVKTRHLSAKRRMAVTGIVLTSQGGTSLGRDRKRQLSAALHQYTRLSPQERSQLAGWLAYANGVEPSYVHRLRSRYGDEALDRALAAMSGAGEYEDR